MAKEGRPQTGRDPFPDDSHYECLLKIASGGMATVYVGRRRGRYGFSRLVAIKRAHAHLLEEDAFRRLLISEAKLASLIHHPNVVSVLDVDDTRDELLLVMDYVEGASLSQLLGDAKEPLPIGVIVQIMIDVAHGLHAAHELAGESGEPLDIVHRDVSPQNVLVGVDGTSRITDFGVAKWSEATQATTAGWKGKFAYMAPEYVRDRVADRRADVFALGVMLWEALANDRLFRGDGGADTMQLVTTHEPRPLEGVPSGLASVVSRALAKDPDARWATARDVAQELERAAREGDIEIGAEGVTETVRARHGAALDARRAVLRGLLSESGETSTDVSALVAGRAPDESTATGAPNLTISDARTLPLARPADRSPAPIEARLDDGPAESLASERTNAPLFTPPPVAPRVSGATRTIFGVAAVAALSAVVTWTLTRAPNTAARATSTLTTEAPVSSIDETSHDETTKGAPAASEATASASVVPVIAAPSATHPGPNADAGRQPTKVVRTHVTTASPMPRASSLATAPTATPTSAATTTSTTVLSTTAAATATPPAATSEHPNRPGLGY